MPSRVAPQDPLIDRLRRATSISALVRFLHDELNWPVDLDAIDDAFYDYEPEELGIKPEHQVAIQSIKQLRPLTSGQPWGIFFVEFDRQKLPMVVLRRVLQGLSLRNREKDKGRQRWHARDLLFISSFGPANDREIALAHFTDETEHGDLPTLRVLGWDGADTNLALAQVATTLREHLRWPSDGDTPTGQQRWRERWSSAFRLRYREAVTTAKDLALALAYLARAIRTRANEVLAVEGPDGPLTKLFLAFKANLMADLSHDRFADMYAQTITYGLFAARVSRGSGGLVADDAALMIPSTNPFLQELLQDFLAASGRTRAASRRGRGTGIDFDELGVNAVVEQLRVAPMDAVLVSFNNARPGDDPVIHFYEDFLKAYDRAMRVERGVFYTPRPVVQFIVRSVHQVLQTEFGIEDGLASTVTWAQMRQRMPDLALPHGTSPDSAFVQILDPAVGTATFLVEAIDLIHGHMRSKWQKAGLNKVQQLDAWNTYVRDHLLTRLHGFELMMAPYAIAHMKLGLKLADTGYRFPDGGPRVRVFLTNSLEPASDIQPQFELMAPMLAHEARQANAVKDFAPITVVIGNPPYSQYSMNLTETAKRHIERFRTANGERLRARNALQLERNINDDYVKFFGYAGTALTSSAGVLGLITNRMFLDSESLVGLREWLACDFRRTWILDLRGSSEEARRVARLNGDENVFDILQGVAITISSKRPVDSNGEIESSCTYAELIGSRESKYERLGRSLDSPDFEWIRVAPSGRTWNLSPLSSGMHGESPGILLSHIFLRYSTLVASNRDHLVVERSRDVLLPRVRAIQQFIGSDQEWLKQFGLTAKKGWNVSLARASLQALDNLESWIRPIEYRALDRRWIFFHPAMVWQAAPVISHGMQTIPGNLLLISLGKNRAEIANGQWVSSVMADKSVVGTRDNASGFPLFVATSHKEGEGVLNISRYFLNGLAKALGVGVYAEDGLPEGLAAQDVFAYIYAQLSSTEYRSLYKAVLCEGFPRVLLPGSRELFESLASLGKQLIELQASRKSDANNRLSAFVGNSRMVSDVAWSNDFVSISGNDDASRRSGFSGVDLEDWEFRIGEYRICEKWLKDRKGTSLTDSDVAMYSNILSVVSGSRQIVRQVDRTINQMGGWPIGPDEGGAFSLDHPPPSAELLAAQAAARPRARRRAAQPGQQSLLESDDEPEPAPARSSAPTPTARTSSEDLDDGETMCALRSALAEASGPFTREELVRAAARALGYSRTSAKLAEALDDAIRRAVRRGIAANGRGALALATRSIEDYERDTLKTQVLAVLRAQRAWVPREDVARLLARWLGFGRTGARIVEATESVLRALVRSGDLQSQDGAVRPA